MMNYVEYLLLAPWKQLLGYNNSIGASDLYCLASHVSEFDVLMCLLIAATEI